ncbi:alpha-hydroxy acid oxidase [Alkalimarinus alittae]|uniref:Alpha-hydroxy-acid oxidizing protein n=1 Tax=Alkalimarinus alittae TaxID=2961619 RepID=A0ABY6MXP9_9ALTE|nr:alpha-hydroxy acid oxidase [Alkalimarinus alittae]UZE94562.1 alpha-hydroxy-acid oxidizing protein [Alkalimarinus alittae]
MNNHIKPALSALPSDLVSVADFTRVAKAHIPPSIFEYIVGGGADEMSLKRNRSAFDEWNILPRVLRDVTQGGTQTNILGETLRHPILLAPVAFQKMVHPSGELATLEAADCLETKMVVSTLSTTEIEKIAHASSQRHWFQLYFQENREFTLSLVKRAERAGYTKLVVTIDAPLHGIRNRAQRAGFELPAGITAINLIDRPPLPRKILESHESVVLQGMMSEAPTWNDIDWLLSVTSLPIILKGILHPEDAKIAKNKGVAGLIISNHGGRALDCVPSGLDVLPAIRQSLGKRYPLLLDGGIERGTDIFKALALGANAVLIGRPQLYALSVAGALGVASMLRILREELEVTMALAGTDTLEKITPQYLQRINCDCTNPNH